MTRPNKIDIKPFDEKYFYYLYEWANVTASALLFSYLLNNFDPKHHWIYRALHCSIPIKMYNLWEPLSKDPNLNKLAKDNPRLSKIKEYLNTDDAWRKIRNSVAHFNLSAETQQKNSTALLNACIFIGFYIEDASVEYKKNSSTASYSPIRMMSGNQGFSDLEVVLDLWNNMVASLNILLSTPLICADTEAYKEIGAKTGNYGNDYLVTLDHGPAIEQFYFEQKNLVKDQIEQFEQFDSLVIILSEDER